MLEDPAELDVRFLGYRLDVISGWPPSSRKVASAEAISRRLTAIARSALVRPDIEGLLHLSCRLLDDFFTASETRPAYLPPTDDICSNLAESPEPVVATRPALEGPRAGMPLLDW